MHHRGHTGHLGAVPLSDGELMEFVLVTPDTLRASWPTIRAALDAVQAKAPEDWIAEDVYHAIKSGQVACHLFYGAGQYAGLLIVRPERAEFSGVPSLHVWVAHSAGGVDVFEAGEGLLKETARRVGATSITFGSPRPGWAKRYRLVSATYEIAP
jgi:hypothetical protein